MLDTQFTTFFLDLEEVCVTSCSNNSLTIQLPRKSHICPFCGTSTERIHDYRIQKIKHNTSPYPIKSMIFFCANVDIIARTVQSTSRSLTLFLVNINV